MSRILLWSVVGVVLLAAVVIAIALAPKVAVLVIVAVGIAALAVRLAFWMRLRGSSEAERDGAAGDRARDEQMQTFQRDKARHTGPGPGIVDRSSRRRRGWSAAAGRRSSSRPHRPQYRVVCARIATTDGSPRSWRSGCTSMNSRTSSASGVHSRGIGFGRR